MKKNFQRKGFTLIELLVVIVILGILSTISVGTFRSYFAKARDSERVSTVQNVAMMVKVDSGGNGDCLVYNYAMTGETTNPCDTESLDPGLSLLLSENDYSMPEGKNGLEYFYGINIGTTAGDNDFFVVVGAEEDVAQNGKQMKAGDDDPLPYVFVDGTTNGIEALIAGTNAAATADALATCAFEDHVPTCSNDWEVYKILPTGILEAVTST